MAKRKGKGKYDEIRDRLAKLRSAAEEAAQEALNVGFREFFDANEDLRSISWTQYTPYFNDGETCYFSVNSDAELNGLDQYGDSSGYDEDEDSEEVTDFPKELYEDVQEFLDSFDASDMLAAYGDHVRVTVHRDGTVDTDDYDHD